MVAISKGRSLTLPFTTPRRIVHPPECLESGLGSRLSDFRLTVRRITASRLSPGTSRPLDTTLPPPGVDHHRRLRFLEGSADSSTPSTPLFVPGFKTTSREAKL